MSVERLKLVAASGLALALAACAGAAKEPVTIGIGDNPTLPPPQSSLIPMVNTAKPVGWAAGTAPVPAQGLKVEAFATGLDHPRWLHVLPNGDVLVAETNTPPQPGDNKGIKGFFAKIIMGGAGAGVKSPNRITLAARRGRRRQGGNHVGVRGRAQLALRHGAGGRHILRRQHRRRGSVSIR